MASRGEVRLEITFGPAATPLLQVAAELARRRAAELTDLGGGRRRALFSLGEDERAYGWAAQLLGVAAGWRATTAEVDGSPESPWVVSLMLSCAREWLRRRGSCGEDFSFGPWPKCRCCPLHDPAWALESAARSPFGLPGMGVLEVPDHLPEDWEEGS